MWSAALGVLQPPAPDSSDLGPLSTVSLAWLPGALAAAAPPQHSVQLPLYTAPGRAHSLASLAVPFAQCADPGAERAVWALAGAAVFIDGVV